MYRLLIILTCSLLWHSATAAKTFSNTASLLLISPINSSIEMSQMKKPSFKERLLKKIIERKIRKAVDEDKAKRLVNRLGIISLVSGIAAPIILLPLYAIASYGLVQVLAIFTLLLMVTAVITGIISLLKRRKLADKQGTHNIPAILGIVFGGGLILLIILIAATFTINY